MKAEHITKLAQQMTDNVLKAIEDGKGAAWLKPWNERYFGNILSGYSYKGFNPFLCQIYNMAHGYSSPHFITLNAAFKMAKQKGEIWNIDDTKRYLTISLAKPFKKEVVNSKGEKEEKTFFTYRLYNVYNIEQIEGWKEKFADKITEAESTPKEPIAPAQDFCDTYLNAENISVHYGGSRAFYRPMSDQIGMPDLQQFVSTEEFYSTFLHEIAHSTGNENRLNRFKPTDSVMFGDDTYSVEELVAELTATYLMSDLNIATGRSIQNSEEYLANWGRKFKENPELIFKAAMAAAKASTYLKKIVAEHQKELATA